MFYSIFLEAKGNRRSDFEGGPRSETNVGYGSLVARNFSFGCELRFFPICIE